MVGHLQRHVAPAVHEPDVALTGGDQVDGVPRLALGQADGEVGVRGVQVGDGGGHEAPHRGREGHQPEVPGHGRGLLVQAGLDLLEVGEQPRAGVHEVPAVPGEDHAAPDPLQQRHPRLPLEALDLLADRARREPEHLGGADDRALGVDRAQGGEGGQVDHEAMLPRPVHDHSLLLDGAAG